MRAAMDSMRSAISRMPDTTASAAAMSGAGGRLRSCCKASPASDNSSVMTSAASSRSRTSPIWPRLLLNSAILPSTYCASRRVRGSWPSAQVSGKSRPLILTTTSPISAVFLVEQLAELGERHVDPPGYRGGGGRDLLVVAVAGLASRGRVEPRHGAFEPRDRVGELAQRRPL